jgi:putative nucleotidyltransferase with HDIG domain
VEEAHQHVDDVEQLYHATVETLAIAVDGKDQVTHGHIRRVQRHTLALARALGVTEHIEIKALEAAALLHDVGKLCVPDHVLNKPGALKDGEYDTMKLHATKGADILSAVKFPYPVVPIVRHHHEYWNGRGYPDGLSGEQIPVGARILAIIDCFDALTSDRPYRRKLRDDEALEMIRERSGTAYDPQMVEQFIKIVPELRRQDRILAEATQPLDVRSPGAAIIVTEGSAASVTAAIARLQIAGGSVLEKVAQLMPEGEACLFAVSPTGSMLLPASATKLAQIACEDLSFPVGSGLSGWVAAHRHTIVNSDPSLDFGERAAQLGFRSATSTPVFAFATVSAVLTVYMPTRGACSDRQARMIGMLAQEVGSELVRREQLHLQPRSNRSPHTFSAA